MLKYEVFTEISNLAFDSLLFFSWPFFPVDVVSHYLTIKIFYARLTVARAKVEHSAHNKEQFGGCIIKITKTLNSLQ